MGSGERDNDGLTAEQYARIERNRLEALERLRRRQMRLQEQMKPAVVTTALSIPNVAQPTASPNPKPKPIPPSLSLSSADVAPSKSLEKPKETFKVRVIVQLESPTTFSAPACGPLAPTYRGIPGAHFSIEGNYWRFPLSSYQTFLERLGPNRPATEDQLPKTVLSLFSSDQPRRTFSLNSIDVELRESLYPFQQEGIELALNRNGRIILADDMGLGKSIQALGIACYYRLEWPLLVITPASMVASWHEQVKRWIPSVPSQQIRVVYDGKAAELDGMINILSYDLAVKLVPGCQSKFNVIIADECHALKNADSKRSRTLVPVLKEASRAILLSGTPALSRPQELYPQIQAVQPKLFPKFFDFGRRYCDGHQGYFGWDFKGASNLRELNLVLERTVMIRRTKDAVLSQLPRKLRHQVFLKISQRDLDTFKKLTELRGIPQDIGDEALEEFQKKAEYMALWKRTAEIKLPAMLEYMDDLLDAGHKMLLFAHHQSVLDAFDGHLLAKKVRFIRIDGRTPPIIRQDLCREFQTDPGLVVAVLSITAASTGLTLTAATTVIFAELFWNPGVLLQAEDRAHRIGQSDAVNVHYLLARGTTDDSIWPLIIKKLALLESVGLGKNDFSSMQKQEHDPAQLKMDRFLGQKRNLVDVIDVTETSD